MENLNKSIDHIIDELFAEMDAERKAVAHPDDMLKDQKPARATADENIALLSKEEKVQMDKARGAGRPEQIHDSSEAGMESPRGKEYDKAIARSEDEDKREMLKEEDQDKLPMQMKKSLSNAEYEEYQELKKAQRTEELKKAKIEQIDLIKAAVSDAVSSIRRENEELKKSMTEQSDLIKAMANKPQRPKAITNISALEKSMPSEGQSSYVSKSDVLDVVEELVMKKALPVECITEVEQTGHLYAKDQRSVLEAAIKRKFGGR